jgi:hypothetical protein
MAYRISARYPGRAVTFTVETEEAALARCEQLLADGVPFEMTDADGVAVDDVDLEDRIDDRGDAET